MIVRLVAVLLFLANLGVARGQNSVTISDYPAHATSVASLDPDKQQIFRAFASGLVGAASTGVSVDVMIIGHADFDAQGRAFEITVSRNRASSAEQAIETFFNQAADAAALPVDRRRLVRISTLGVGTQRPVNPRPVNEEQRKANRRVELVFITTPPPPPDPRAKFENCVRVLAGAAPPGPARRMSCVCSKLLQQPPPFVKDYVYNFHAALLARAGAGDMSQFTTEQMSALYRGFMLFVRHQIDSVSGSDPDVRAGLFSIDDSIGSDLDQFISQAELGAGPFEKIVSIDILKRMQDPNHIYACYAGYSRRDPNR
ncbi:MAG: hypothetical protein JWO56_2686 [Acidobacteria bacterium]|nr:hypothetical protein [Acidobacteriota bacterium]